MTGMILRFFKCIPGEQKVDNDFTAELGWLEFEPGQEVRRFVEVPDGATWAEMRLTANEEPRQVTSQSTEKCLLHR